MPSRREGASAGLDDLSDVDDDDDAEDVIGELFRGDRRPDAVDDEHASLAMGAGVHVGASVGVGGLGVSLGVSQGAGLGVGLGAALPPSSSLNS